MDDLLEQKTKVTEKDFVGKHPSHEDVKDTEEINDFERKSERTKHVAEVKSNESNKEIKSGRPQSGRESTPIPHADQNGYALEANRDNKDSIDEMFSDKKI